MRILYFHCFSGISGDMSLASLVDAGADQAYIENELKKIQIEPFQLEWSTVNKLGITAKRVQVVVPEAHQPHHHRHYHEIVELIEEAGFNERVTNMSLRIFEQIGKAEAKIHGIPLEHVHFHEVGAIDSIVDTIGVALAIDSLNVDQIIASPVPLGSGMVRCDHGLYPVPAPATLEIMKGLPIAPSKHQKELTTPTGAGIIAALADHFSHSLPAMIVENIGYGAGTRDLPDQPNVLRTVVGTIDNHHAYFSSSFKQNEHHHHEGHAHDHPHHHHHGHSHHHHHHEHSHKHDHGHGHHHHEHSHKHDHGHSHHHHHEHSHDHNHNHDVREHNDSYLHDHESCVQKEAIVSDCKDDLSQNTNCCQ